jgi:hypothetical protein
VNRLVSALIAHPQVIEETAGREDLRFGRLLDALGNEVFSESELHRIQSDPHLRERLEAGYLAAITAVGWEHALSLAENRTATSSGWWTVMIAGPSGRFGVTVPQDDSRAELVALFTGPADSAAVLVYDPALVTVGEAVDGPHCGPPSRNRCNTARCSGCKISEVYDRATHSSGIKCLCPHQVV